MNAHNQWSPSGGSAQVGVPSSCGFVPLTRRVRSKVQPSADLMTSPLMTYETQPVPLSASATTREAALTRNRATRPRPLDSRPIIDAHYRAVEAIVESRRGQPRLGFNQS